MKALREKFADHFIVDIRAGLVVFLIALPLSLGISLASGAPSTAGLISAALGGLMGAYLGGSAVTINGPAAGLIVVVLGAINSLGGGDPLQGFQRMLACVIIVGVLQIVSGLLKAGRFAALFPSSVVHGMLSAIGLIIMIKQFHVFFGHKAQGSIIASIIQMPQTLIHLNAEAALIGLAAMVVLITYPNLKLRVTKYIPAPLIVVGLGILAAQFFTQVSLVKIPTNISEFFVAPKFDVITSPESLLAIFSLFFVASLESILSASAVDKLDPYHRESDFNRELWSKGVVNIACGLLGGLPIIAEIVRSSASISQGAKTPFANFSHGFFILAFVLISPSVLNLIPLPALAAILMLVGFKLAHPRQLLEMKKLGPSAMSAFVTTIVLTLAEDLLVGIFAGVVMKALVSMLYGVSLKQFFSPKFRLQSQGDQAILHFEDSLMFFSALKQKAILEQLVSYSDVEINLTGIQYMDPTSMAIISREGDRLKKSGKKVTFKLPEKFKPVFLYLSSH